MRTICELIDYGGKTGSSFTDGLQRLAREVRARGDRFVVIATPVQDATWGTSLEKAGADVRYVSSNGEARQTLRELRPHVVHSHFTRYDVAAVTGRFGRVFWHVHSVREDHSATARIRAQIKYRLIGTGVREWLCVSDGIAQEVRANGAPAARVRVLSNGIDTERFRPPSGSEREAARASFGIAPDDRVLLFFDRTPVKGGAVLREALAAISNVRLLVNGGPDADWERFTRERNAVRAPRMEDPRRLYWAADAFVLASLGEGFAFVLAEAAACGLPIATTAIPPAREMLGGLAGVYFARPGNADELALAIAAAMKAGASDEVRARIVDRFSLDRWTRDLLERYYR